MIQFSPHWNNTNLLLLLCCQTQWMPITQDLSANRFDSLQSPVPLVDNTSLYIDVITEQTNNTTPTPIETRDNEGVIPAAIATPIKTRPSPLPVFPWADSHELWQTMIAKEELPGYKRDQHWFARHPAIQPRLRTVLLDWLMEVGNLAFLKTVPTFFIDYVAFLLISVYVIVAFIHHTGQHGICVMRSGQAVPACV